MMMMSVVLVMIMRGSSQFLLVLLVRPGQCGAEDIVLTLGLAMRFVLEALRQDVAAMQMMLKGLLATLRFSLFAILFIVVVAVVSTTTVLGRGFGLAVMLVLLLVVLALCLGYLLLSSSACSSFLGVSSALVRH